MSTDYAVNHLRLVGVSGTNKVMAGEFSRLAGRLPLATKLPVPKKEGLGALIYPFEPQAAALAARYHRTSIRVLWDLYESRASRLDPLFADLLEQVQRDDRDWMVDGFGISVDARRVGDFAAGERQVVGAVKNAIIEGAASHGIALHLDPEEPDLLFDVRLREGTLCVSIDLAGRAMHQRGYRRTGGVAPLKENLAAVLVMLGRHHAQDEPLVDPMCGSGTIAIEGACMGMGIPVWVPPRKPACTRLPPLAEACAGANDPLFPTTRPLVIANELDPAAFGFCQDHVERAGVSRHVNCISGDFRDLSTNQIAELCKKGRVSAARGLILSNPPYGERLSPPELIRLYRELGLWCRRFHGWRAAFLVAHPEFEGAFGGRPRIKKPLTNGRIRSNFLMYDL